MPGLQRQDAIEHPFVASIYLRACWEITLRSICVKFSSVHRYFFRRIARIRLQKMPYPKQNLSATDPKATPQHALKLSFTYQKPTNELIALQRLLRSM